MLFRSDENLYYNMGRAHFEAGHPDKAEQSLAEAMQLNPDFKEGAVFYQYLLKLNRPAQASPPVENKSGGFLKRIFGK